MVLQTRDSISLSAIPRSSREARTKQTCGMSTKTVSGSTEQLDSWSSRRRPQSCGTGESNSVTPVSPPPVTPVRRGLLPEGRRSPGARTFLEPGRKSRRSAESAPFRDARMSSYPRTTGGKSGNSSMVKSAIEERPKGADRQPPCHPDGTILFMPLRRFRQAAERSCISL